MIGSFFLRVLMVWQDWTKLNFTSYSTKCRFPEVRVPQESDLRPVWHCHPPSSNQITINRPERRNAFRPETVSELQRAFTAARDDPTVGAIIFTGQASLDSQSRQLSTCTRSTLTLPARPLLWSSRATRHSAVGGTRRFEARAVMWEGTPSPD